MAVLHLLRGLPGSGKSTRARRIRAVLVEADQYFERKGPYRFDATKTGAAHKWAQDRAGRLLSKGQDVAVANVFPRLSDLAPYRKLAEQHGAKVQVVDLFDGGKSDKQLAGRNVHGVPVAVISKLRDKWEAGDA